MIKLKSSLLLSLCGFLLVIAACSSSGKIPQSYRLSKASGMGLGVVSLTQSAAPGYNSFDDWNVFVSLRGVRTDFDVTVPLHEVEINDRGAVVGEATGERLAVFELPRGQYEFYDWEGHTSGSDTKLKIRPRAEFSKKFNITAGHIAYIGNLHMVFSGNTYMLLVLNMSKTDLALFREEYPGLKSEKVRIKIMR